MLVRISFSLFASWPCNTNDTSQCNKLYTHIQFQQSDHKFLPSSTKIFVTNRNRIALSFQFSSVHLKFALVMTHIKLVVAGWRVCIFEKKSDCIVKIESLLCCSHYTLALYPLSITRSLSTTNLSLFGQFVYFFLVQFSSRKCFIFLVHCLVVIAKWMWRAVFHLAITYRYI